MSKRLIERHLQNRISKLNVIRIIHKKKGELSQLALWCQSKDIMVLIV